jgi:hypothetical protein
MNSFHYDLAKAHGDELRRDADHARLARAARSAHSSSKGGFLRSRRAIVIGALAASAAAGATFSAASGSTPSHTPTTPNECITLNGGDYNACNVGNTGRGDLPYQPASSPAPTDCVRHKYGDTDLCRAGDQARDNVPDRPALL